MPRPLVALTMDRRSPGPTPPGPRARPPRPEVYLQEPVLDCVRAAGGLALLLPPGPLASDDLGRLLDRVDAVVITGGPFDIDPRWYGQQQQGRLDRVDDGRTVLELALARACVDRDLPLLGLCGGLQAMVVAAGGTLVQDIVTALPQALEHEQPTDPATAWHPVAATGLLAALLGPELQVNSTHHQAADAIGPYQVVGRAPDGVIEAIALPGHPFALGVQWHPELLDQGALFAGLVDAARNRHS